MLEYDKNGSVIGATNKPSRRYSNKVQTPAMDFGKYLKFYGITLSKDRHFILDLRYTDPKQQVKLAFKIGNVWKKYYSGWRTENQRSLEIKVRAQEKYKSQFLGHGVEIHWC